MFEHYYLTGNSECTKPSHGSRSLSWPAILATLLIVASHAPAEVVAQDISGGASESIKLPSKTPRKKTKSQTQPGSTRRGTRTTANGSAASSGKVDVSKEVESALELGNAARDSKPPRYADAEQAYALALRLDPNEARAYVGLGNTFFDQKHFPEAETAFVRAIALDPKDADAMVALAYTQNVQGHYQDAERTALRAIALDANSYTANVALGWSRYQLKNYAGSETAYRRAISLSPQTPAIYAELGIILMEQRRWRDSEEVLLQAASLDPTNALTISNHAVALHKLGQLEKAAESYSQAITLDPTTSSPHSNLALILYTRGDFARAREEWETAIRLSSTYTPDRAGLLILDRKLDAAAQELETYTQANALDEDGWLLLGDVRRMQRNSAGASAAYARAVQIAPDYAQLARPIIPEPKVTKAKSTSKSESKEPAAPAVTAPNKSTEVARQQNPATLEPKIRYATSVRTIKPTNNARPTPASGSISVTCNPSATVLVEFMGGGEALMSVVPTSLTVLAFNQLRPGEYRVAATLDGFEPIETRVFVAVTKIISIKLIMRPRA